MLLTNVELLGERLNRVREDRSVEVHGHLHEGDGTQVRPFLPTRPAVSQLVVAMMLLELTLPIRTHLIVIANAALSLRDLLRRRLLRRWSAA